MSGRLVLFPHHVAEVVGFIIHWAEPGGFPQDLVVRHAGERFSLELEEFERAERVADGILRRRRALVDRLQWGAP